ncbi:MAG: aldo/keto reductase, partial [Spirochaetes bacterium]|nr:aldo/keto reductase [Spirochaetota bacterium]
GFNFLNQTARSRVLAKALENNIGVVCMFAVRQALINPDNIRAVLEKLIAERQINPDDIDLQNPLVFIQDEENSYVDAAYRYCRDEPGIHSVLSGTGNISHLEQNILSMQKPALSQEILAKLSDIFQSVNSVAGNLQKS